MPANYSFSGRVILLPEAQPLGGARVDVWNSSKSVQWGRGETAPDGKFACPLAVPANSETLPDQDLITFAVYQGDQLLSPVASSVSWRPSAIMAAAIVLGDAAIEVAVAPQQPIHAEVGLHELTGGISAVIASMQQQLAVYSSDLGTFVVDTLELTLPVHMRVDQLGQVMATVVGGNDSSTATSLHLQIRPVAASSTAPPLTREPLTTLRMLSDVAIAQLQSLRVFSIDDLLPRFADCSGPKCACRPEAGGGPQCPAERGSAAGAAAATARCTDCATEIEHQIGCGLRARRPTEVGERAPGDLVGAVSAACSSR